MSNLYEEYGLEEEEISPVYSYKPEKKKGGWLGRIVALLLGFVIGIGACVGAVCAILFSPVSTPLSLIGMSQEDQAKLISKDYLDDSILTVIGALAAASSEGTISAYDAISPAIGDTIRDFSDKLLNEMGIDLNKDDQLIDSKIADLPITLSDSVKTTPVGNIFRASNNNEDLAPMLMEICYGVEGKDYTYDKKGNIVMIGDAEATTLTTLSSDPTSVINRVTIASVVDPNPDDTVMLAIAYGQSGITFELETDKKGNYVYDEDGRIQVTMLQKFIEKDKNGDFIDHNGKLLQCKATPADNDFTKIDQYKVDSDNELVLNEKGKPIVIETYYVTYDKKENKYFAYEEADKKSEPVLFKKTLLGDMTEDSSKIIDNLLLKDVIELDFSSGEEPNGVLVSLAYGTEGEDFEYIYDKKGNITGVNPINDPRTIGQLRSRGDDLINDIPLCEILSENRNDAITMYLLYGKEGLHYDIDADTDELIMHPKFIVKVGTALYNEYGELMQKRSGTEGSKDFKKGYILDSAKKTYTDRRGNTYTYKAATDLNLTTVKDFGPNLLKNLDISIFDGLDKELGSEAFKALLDSLLEHVDSSFLESLDPSIYDDEEALTALVLKHLDAGILEDLPITFYYLYDEDGEQVNFPKTTLGDLAYSDNPIANLTKRMTIGEVLGEDNINGNKFLKHVSDSTIDDLPTAIEGLTMRQVFEEDMYLDNRYTPAAGEPKSYVDANGVEVREGDFIDANGNFLPEDQRTMKGIWKYMLMDGNTDADGNPTYTDYKVATEMNPMLDQMTKNIQNAKLNDLDADGIMDFDDAMLETSIKETVNGTPITDNDGNELTYPGRSTLGELTVTEMLEYTAAVLRKLPD